MDIFTDYFSECTEMRIKENYVIVYEVSKQLPAMDTFSALPIKLGSAVGIITVIVVYM